MVNIDSIDHDHDDMSTCFSSTLSSTIVKFSGRFGSNNMSVHVFDQTIGIERSNNNNNSINNYYKQYKIKKENDYGTRYYHNEAIWLIGEYRYVWWCSLYQKKIGTYEAVSINESFCGFVVAFRVNHRSNAFTWCCIYFRVTIYSIAFPSTVIILFVACFQFFSHFPFVLFLLLNLSFCLLSSHFLLSLICGSISSADALAIEKAMVWLVLSDWQTTVLELNASQPSSMPHLYQEL